MYWYIKIKDRRTILWAGLILGIVSCFTTGCIDQEEAAHFETNLISLDKIVDSVFMTSSQDSVVSVTKTIQVNSRESETRQFQDYNIRNDLETLKEFDVATPRWADLVQTSVKDSAGLRLITYTIDNTRAPVQKISFVKDGNQLQSLKVYSQKKSMVSQQKTTVHWVLGENYTFQNESKLIFRKQSTFAMNVTY